MKPHSDCFNAKLNHTSDLEKSLGEHATTKKKTITLLASLKQLLNSVICKSSPTHYFATVGYSSLVALLWFGNGNYGV